MPSLFRTALPRVNNTSQRSDCEPDRGDRSFETCRIAEKRTERSQLTKASLLPRTISDALRYDVAFYRLHVLPHQFAAIFGQALAIVFGR